MMTMTPQPVRRAVRRVLLALILVAGSTPVLVAGALHAQDLPEPGDGFTWQRVGDVALNPKSLAFGPDLTLWATGRRADVSLHPQGPYRLDLSGGFPGVWVYSGHHLLSYTGPILVLGRGPAGDTLLIGTGSTRRSVDGGQTWAVVHHRGGGGLYEIPAGYPYAGRILTSARDGLAAAIAYSDDRGATFTEGVVPGPGGYYAYAEDFVALPPGSDHPGRILAAGRWGVNISDDGGATFRESGLWQVLYYFGNGVAAIEEPGGGAVMGGEVNAQALARAWSSADEGQTWGPAGDGQPLMEGPPNLTYGVKAVLSLGGSSVLVVLHKGTVYRSDDAGATWAAVGRAPDVGASGVSVKSAVVGPDRRLYLGLSVAGGGEGWVWRTKETHDPIPVSSEPPPIPGERLGLEVHPNPSRGTATVVLTLPEAGAVAAALYDVLGRRVAVLHEGVLAAGRHPLTVETGSLPAGVYVVRVEAGGVVQTALFTLAR